MPFFSEGDRKAREGVVNPPRDDEATVRKRSIAMAHENLADVLKSIRSSYRDGARGASFSYDSAPFVGPYQPKQGTEINQHVRVEELMRLVTQHTGLRCERAENSGPVKSGFSVTFK